MRKKDSDISPELAEVLSLRHRTFQMWEDEFARRAAGEAPSFTYTSVAGRLEDLRQTDPMPDIPTETIQQWMHELSGLRALYEAALTESELRSDKSQ
jgi:hypothetical protein